MKINLKTAVEINGLGDSLWAGKSNWGTEDKSSKGPFSVTKFIVNEIDYEEGNGIEPYELQLFGPDTEWFHYTDSQIKKEVNEKILPLIQGKYPTIKEIGWSEQGMQPKDGWSFDILN